MKGKTHFWRWLVVAAALAAGCAALLPLKDWSDELTALILEMDLVSGLLLFCAVYVAATLLLAPAWIFPLLAGAAFGMAWGLAVAVVAGTLSAIAAFVIARYLARGPVEKAARRSASFRAVDQAVAREPRKIVALLRMSPVLPSGLKSYFLGLTRIGLPDYALGSFAGMLPGLALKVYVGAAGRNALSDGSALDWSLFAAGALATLALTVVLGRRVRKKLEL